MVDQAIEEPLHVPAGDSPPSSPLDAWTFCGESANS
jgi:hypothetical protein